MTKVYRLKYPLEAKQGATSRVIAACNSPFKILWIGKDFVECHEEGLTFTPDTMIRIQSCYLNGKLRGYKWYQSISLECFKFIAEEVKQ